MEYIVNYLELIKHVGRAENAIGWYHSHPGYGCWLSGIDVATQMMYQQYQEPWLAIVVDPKRTINSGKVELGAFRTYPKDYKPPDEGPSEYQTIPLEKIEDFGVHCKQYYPLEVPSPAALPAPLLTRAHGRSRTSSRRWTRSCWTCCGTSTG
jgi:COP9 signalosome complex subunit 5